MPQVNTTLSQSLAALLDEARQKLQQATHLEVSRPDFVRVAVVKYAQEILGAN
jgi:ribosome maturation factor RimP